MFSNRTRTKGRRWCTTPLLYHPERYSWIYATGRERKEDGKTLVCDKRDRAITCAFCRDLVLFKGKWSLAKSCFKQNYCHACHTRFAVFFPLPYCCVSSLLPQPAHQGDMHRTYGIFKHFFSLICSYKELIRRIHGTCDCLALKKINLAKSEGLIWIILRK